MTNFVLKKAKFSILLYKLLLALKTTTTWKKILKISSLSVQKRQNFLFFGLEKSNLATLGLVTKD